MTKQVASAGKWRESIVVVVLGLVLGITTGCGPALIRLPEATNVQKFTIASVYVERGIKGSSFSSEEFVKDLAATTVDEFSRQMGKVGGWQFVPPAEIKGSAGFAQLVKAVQTPYDAEKSPMLQDETDKYRSGLKRRFVAAEGMPFIHLRGDGSLDLAGDGEAIKEFLKDAGLDSVVIIEVSSLSQDNSEQVSLGVGMTIVTREPGSSFIKYAAVGKSDAYRFTGGEKPEGFASLMKVVSGVKAIASDPVAGLKKEAERLTGLFKEASQKASVGYVDLLMKEKAQYLSKVK